MKSHCVNGHPLIPNNVVYVNGGRDKPHKRKCRICLNERKRKYRAGNTEKTRSNGKKYAAQYFSKNKNIVVDAKRTYRHKIRQIVLDHYGRKCACCGETIEEFLCVDHINNDGNKHRKSFKTYGGASINAWLIKNDFPTDFQILCFNCNSAKHIYGLCPHTDGFNLKFHL